MLFRSEGNRFQVRTSKPEVKVSWRVEATRNDLYMRAHPATTEQQKNGFERGTYQHPELHQQPLEKGLQYKMMGDGAQIGRDMQMKNEQMRGERKSARR